MIYVLYHYEIIDPFGEVTRHNFSMGIITLVTNFLAKYQGYCWLDYI